MTCTDESMSAGQRRYEVVASIISGYGRQLPEWDELRPADQEKLEALPGPDQPAATVTVTAWNGAERAYQATEIQPAPDGYLRLYANGKTILAVARGGWISAEEDGHRIPAGDAAALEEIAVIVSGPVLAEELAREGGDATTDELRRIRDILGRRTAAAE